MSGFMGKILRVNLSDGSSRREDTPMDLARLYLGGNGLATKILMDEVPVGADPLGPHNKLIYMTGPLTGTLSPSSGRFSAVAKSPLTGLWGSANSGGRFGLDLKKTGLDGVIIEGMASQPVYLLIEDDEVALLQAEDLWGMEVGQTTKVLKKRHPKFNVSCIGPAGENLVRYLGDHERRAPGPWPLRAGRGDGQQEPQGHHLQGQPQDTGGPKGGL